MKQLTFATALSLTALSVLAATPTNATKRVNIRDIPKEQRAAIMLQLTGGVIGKPGTMQGKIVFVNAQKTAPRQWIETIPGYFNGLFRNKLRFNFEIHEGTFSLPNPKVEGEATLFIIDDPTMPPSLLASENRWCMVNLSRLKEGDGQKPQFYEARVKKTVMRGTALLCGAQDSKYPRCLLTCKTDPSQLDVNPDTRLPVDVVARFEKYLAGYGIKPEQIKFYRVACEEGWAPNPTNDIQREVWDDVHALPTKPIKILPETKKVTE